jgi:antitoxin Phd
LEIAVKTLQVRDAKAGFSGVIVAAEKGRPTLITRHGQPMAMVVPVEAGRKLYPVNKSSLADYLLALPECIEVDRDAAHLRTTDL